MGYKQNEITFFTCPDTGIKLPIRKVSPDLIQRLEKKIRTETTEPKPPLQTVDYGNGPVQEANWAEPGYLAAHEAWEREVNQKMQEQSQDMLLYLGVVKHIKLDDEMLAQVQEMREDADRFGLELDKDDKSVWVRNIALGTVEDLTDLVNRIIRRSQPTEEAVEEAQSRF